MSREHIYIYMYMYTVYIYIHKMEINWRYISDIYNRYTTEKILCGMSMGDIDIGFDKCVSDCYKYILGYVYIYRYILCM